MNKLVIIGGSAGSFSIICRLVEKLDKTLSFPILICAHRSRQKKDDFINALQYKTSIRIKECENNELPQDGVIYVAPAGYHLVFRENCRFALNLNPTVNFSRPSIDVSMIAAANIYNENLCGILISGANNDGASGMDEVQKQGGFTIIQDPYEAEISIMPNAALNRMQPDLILKSSGIIDYIREM